MNDRTDFGEWEQNNDGMDLEDRRQDFYDQLHGWVQKSVEVRKMNAEVDAEYRFLRDYAQSNGFDMTTFIFPEGSFVMVERRCPVTKDLLLKHCEGLVSETVLNELFDRINAREVKRYQVFRQKRKNQTFAAEE